ncbi:MAG TPA: hypothetical protein VKK31_21950 [Thermoanaerobaculia bacterium]|nr:hypothetical protein [Thermoanaerobaculia bacterium]
MNRCILQKNLGVVGILLALLIGGAPAAQAQDLTKLATDLAARIHAVKHDRVTVVDFLDLDKKPNKLGQFLSQKLQVALAEPAHDLSVVDQTQLPQLFDQIKLLDEGLIDPATRRELGKITGTEVVIVGTVMVSSMSVKLDVKAIDLQTAKVITGERASLMRIGSIEKLANESSDEEKMASEDGEDEVQAKPASQKSGKSSRAPVRSRSDQGMSFDLDGCSLSGDSLTCAVTVTSEGRDRWLSVSFGSRAWNDTGDEYGPTDMMIANSQWTQRDCAPKQVLKNVPTRVSMTFPNFGDSSDVERLRLYWTESNGCCYQCYRPVDFEKIAVSDDESSSSRIASRSGKDQGGAGGGSAKRKGGVLQRFGGTVLDILEKRATQIIEEKTGGLVGGDDEAEDEDAPPKKKKKKGQQ